MTVCTGPECPRPAVAKGLCHSHNMQRRRGGPLKIIVERSPRVPCAGPECDRIGGKLNLCMAHRGQFLRTGKTWPIGSRGLNGYKGPGRTPEPNAQPSAAARAKAANLPAGWFETTIEKPRNPGSTPGGHINPDALTTNPTTPDQNRNAALAAAAHAANPDELDLFLRMLGLKETTTHTKVA